ncbi:hypothetical protein GCM10009119_37910 [Algoriphagus jejuensis]|uniref:histidine kinase n=1 Tax=Algoriphagus jejuensis TaxID=419934 RepID=A0ABN1N512_9BACT
MSTTTNDFYFLQRGGEMGELIRAKDWSKTPLGNPESWPQSLRTMVSVMLDNPFGMYIAWGKEYTQIYNDGYRPILGASKHPQALGISTRETFAEIWHIIESMFDGVMEGVPVGFPDFMLQLDRNGYLETCYFDFAYSPIRLENGEVGGVLVTVVETTGKKKAVEDLTESENRFRTMAEGTDIYVAVGDESSNATYFNEPWVRLTGRPMEELLEFGWVDLIHPEDRERYVNIYLDAFKKREPFTGEFRILNSKGDYRWLLAQGPPRFRPDGSFAGYISSCMDITDKKEFETELTESKNQLLFAIEAAQLGTWDYDPIADILTGNKRLKGWFGVAEDDKIELAGALSAIKENDRPLVTAAIQKALQYESGGGYDIEYTIIHPVSKKETIVHAKGRAWFNDNKVAYRLNGTLEDITEKAIANRKRRETEQHIRTMVSESPVGICVMDAATLESEIVNDSFVEIAGKPYDSIVGKHYWDTFAEARTYYEEALNSVVETGQPFYANEVELMLIRHGKEEIVYVTFVYAPLKDEAGKVMKVAVWVLENTQQVAARKKIMISENNLRLMILQAPIAIAILRGKEYSVEIANKYALELWGRTEQEVLNRSIFESMPELSTQGIKELLDGVSRTGNRFATPELPIQIVRNGVLETIYINFSYEALYDGDGKIDGIMTIGFDVTQQVEARKKVEASETRYNLMLMQSPFAFLILKEKEMVVQLANESMVEVLGKGPDIIGMPLLEVLPELKGQAFPDLLDGVYTTGIPFSANEMLAKLHRKGKLEDVYFNFVYQPYYEADKSISGVTVIAYDVTSTVTAKKKIEESEQRFHNLIYSSPSAIGILDGEDLIITVANDAILEIWGKGREIIGKSYFEALPELADQGYKEIFREVYKTGVPFTAVETPVYVKQDGDLTLKYYNFLLFAQRNLEGDVDGIGIIATEVTSQAIFNNRIKESEQRIRTLVDSAPFPIGVYEGEELRIVLANQSIMDIWGKGNDVVGKLYTEILPELANQKIFDQVLEVLHTGMPFHAKNQRVDLQIDGVLRSFYFNYSFTPLFDVAGKPYAVMNTAAEVTELHEAKQKVEESEKRFRDSVKQAPLGIAIFRGKDFIAEMANENYLLLADKQEHEFVGQPLFEVLPEVKGLVEPLFNEVIRNGNPFYSPELLATLKRHGRLEQAYFNLVYHPLKEESGEIHSIMVVATEVTHTVIAKHLLEESEKHFRHMVMQSPIPMTILRGKDFIIESANQVMFENIWRKQETDVLGKSILDVFPELKEQKYPDLLHQVFSTGHSHTEKESVAYVQGDDGVKRFFLDFEYAALQDPDGNSSGIMITVNDVTDKVEARKKVEEAEERSRLAAEATDLATWELDLQTREIIHSPRLAEIFGYDSFTPLTQAEIRKQIVSEDRQNIVEKAFEKALNEGTYFVEARIIRNDGSLRWIRVQGKAIYNDLNKPVKMVGTLRDVTEEKQYQQVLLEREQKFRLLANSMPQHVWTADPEGNMTYFNQSVYDYSGLRPAQLDHGWIQMIHPDEREENIKRWMNAIRTGEDYWFEHRFLKSNGEYRWHLSRAVPQRDSNGKIKMWVGTSNDIQNQKMFTKELENQVQERTNELNQRNLDLEKINKELEAFVYISSHDLQEPLRKIQTFASRILETEYSNLSEKGMSQFSRMQESAFRMQNLIQDLLAYSRTTTQEQKFEVVDLAKVVDEIREILREELEQKNVNLILNSCCSLKIIPFQFNQLLLNLIGNSIKFSRLDHPLQIDIDCTVGFGWEFGLDKLAQDREYRYIRVADNGIGFEQQYSDKIFQVFQRLHRKEEYEGTGIGLAIVKKIIDNHNGIIFASGEINKGAIFHIYIPG